MLVQQRLLWHWRGFDSRHGILTAQPGHGVVDLPSQSICEGWMLLGSVWQLETKLSIRRNRDET
jgi:hypothetical protein